jgi:hypothetical protein
VAALLILSKSQRNKILEKIQKVGLDPADFQWSEVQSQLLHGQGNIVSLLRHLPTGFYIRFDFCPARLYEREAFVTERCPGMRKFTESLVNQDFDMRFEHASEWVELVHHEVETPDLWAEVAKSKELAEAAEALGDDNSPFSESERSVIEQRFDELEGFIIKNYITDRAHRQLVEQQLRYLVGAANRLGRKDWLILVFGQLISMGTTLAMNADKIGGVLSYAAKLLGASHSGLLIQ